MIVVNPSTRQFNIPGADLVFGVESDSGSVRKYFQCPRYVGNNLDLAASFIRMNYRNANGEIDSYLVDDLTVDGENVTFSWKLYPKVTAYKGQLKFVMCVAGPDTKVAWHTTLGTGIVLEGLEPDYAVIQAGTADVVAQLISMVEAQTATVEKVGADQVAVVKDATKAAQDSAVAEIEAKRVNSLNSIPNDYTAMQRAVDGLTRGRAGAIVCEAAGSSIIVSDASDLPIQSMRIFGRSTQDGVPTPDAPVEIKSVESPVVMVAGKNLLDSDAMINGQFVKNADGTYTLTKNGASTLRFSKRAYCDIPKGSYIVSVDSVTGLDNMVRIAFTFTSGKEMSVTVTPTVSKTFIAEEDITRFATYLPSDVADGSYTTFANLMLEPGSVATSYEPYKAAQTVATTNTLRGIPVTSGGNYTAENGQQWICDEVDLERGVYVQRVGVRVLAASGAYRDAASQIDGFYTTYIQHNDIYLPIAERAISDKMPCYPGTSYKTLAAEGVFGNSGVLTTDVIVIRVSNDRATDVLSFNEWIKNNPITVYYPLAAPNETPLSETEIAAYRALHTNKPNTTIVNDSGAHMKVEYAADTKLYIDNKLSALVGNI